jgi:hypothetical protein
MQNNSGLIDVPNNNPIDSIFNKTCNEISNRLIANTNPTQQIVQDFQQILQVPQMAQVTQIGGNTVNQGVEDIQLLNNIVVETKSNYYNILGYEFSLWMLILALIVLLTIIYFIYKWFFTSNEQIVNIKKSKDTPKINNSNNKEKLNEEITDSEDESESEETATVTAKKTN